MSYIPSRNVKFVYLCILHYRVPLHSFITRLSIVNTPVLLAASITKVAVHAVQVEVPLPAGLAQPVKAFAESPKFGPATFGGGHVYFLS
jgi:hypothetical protein